MVCFCVLVEAMKGRNVARKGGGDEPPVHGDRIELPVSWVEGLVAMGATSLVWEQLVWYGSNNLFCFLNNLRVVGLPDAL